MEFTLKSIIPASPEKVYKAWMSSYGHSQMTGSPATISAEIGGKFTAWDEYIFGSNIELTPDVRIIQSWRTSDFEPEDFDSRVEIILVNKDGHTELTLIHTNLSEEGSQYIQGWEDFYFQPMKAFFSSNDD